MCLCQQCTKTMWRLSKYQIWLVTSEILFFWLIKKTRIDTDIENWFENKHQCQNHFRWLVLFAYLNWIIKCVVVLSRLNFEWCLREDRRPTPSSGRAKRLDKQEQTTRHWKTRRFFYYSSAISSFKKKTRPIIFRIDPQTKHHGNEQKKNCLWLIKNNTTPISTASLRAPIQNKRNKFNKYPFFAQLY
jgi:hypothetical protein